MTPATTFAGQKLALFGLGGSGLATLRSLIAGGADVLAWDDNAGSRDRARDLGITVTDLSEADWSGFSALVLAPGVPLTHPEPHWTVARNVGTVPALLGWDRARIARRVDERHKRCTARLNWQLDRLEASC